MQIEILNTLNLGCSFITLRGPSNNHAIFKSWTYTLFDNMNQGYTRFILCCSVVLVLRFSELNELNNRTRRRGVIDFNIKPCNITWLLDGPLRVIKLQPRFKVFNISSCMYYSIVPRITTTYVNLFTTSSCQCR
jgi:hypothetical protein